MIERGRAIASGRLTTVPGSADYQGHHLPGLLRSLGARQPGNRVPVGISEVFGALRQELERQLDNDPAVLAGDPTWLRIPGCTLQTGGTPAVGYLLTAQQVNCLHTLGGRLGGLELPNGQVAQALLLEPGSLARPTPQPLVKQAFCPAGLTYGKEQDGWWAFQSQPSSDYQSIIPSAHAFHVVLHERFKSAFRGPQFLILRNRELEERFPALETRFPVRRCFSADIDPECAAVEETALIACGIREGEPCWVAPMQSRWWTPFAYRHVVARVGPVATVDQDKPLCRLPESVLDVLGVNSGELVQLETLSHDGDKTRILRRSIRALVEREDRQAPPLRGGAPDFFDELGSVDLPLVRLDGARQKDLGVSRGSPLYVRPRVSDYVQREGSAIGLLLVGGIIATVAGNHLVLAAVFGALLVLGAVVRALIVVRR